MVSRSRCSVFHVFWHPKSQWLLNTGLPSILAFTEVTLNILFIFCTFLKTTRKWGVFPKRCYVLVLVRGTLSGLSMVSILIKLAMVYSEILSLGSNWGKLGNTPLRIMGILAEIEPRTFKFNSESLQPETGLFGNVNRSQPQAITCVRRHQCLYRSECSVCSPNTVRKHFEWLS